MKKAFTNRSHNGIHLTFPNGIVTSTIWGAGSYSENHDILLNAGTDIRKVFEQFLSSDNAELYFLNCPAKLQKSLEKKYSNGENQPFGYLSITTWLEIINEVASYKGKVKKID